MANNLEKIESSLNKAAEFSEKLAKYNGIEKAAFLMIGLGKDVSAQILKQLSKMDRESIVAGIARTDAVEPKIMDNVFLEFYHMIKAQEYLSIGGIDYARSLLQEALGDGQAMEIIKRIERILQVKGFNVLKQVDSTQLLTFIQNEHPQTIALILTQLEREQAAQVLTKLPEEIRNDVVMRFSDMDRVSESTIDSIEKVLEDRIDFSKQGSQFGGVEAAAEIINLSGASTERSVMEALSEKDPKLAAKIKNLMFVFADIAGLQDRVIQKILREVDQKDLTYALKGVEDDVKSKVLSNISERAAQTIEEEMDFMGPVRLSEVEEAQQKILDVVRKLEELGEITVSSGADEFVG